MHWPVAFAKQDPYNPFPTDENGEAITVDIPIVQTWKAMENLVKIGKARSIGVSNFSPTKLDEILAR
jgi:L-glyceraldehyde reductase